MCSNLTRKGGQNMKKKKMKKKAEKKKTLVECGGCHKVTEFDGPNCRKCGLPLELVGYERL